MSSQASAAGLVLRRIRCCEAAWFRVGGEVPDRQWRNVLSILRVRDRDPHAFTSFETVHGYAVAQSSRDLQQCAGKRTTSRA